MPANTRRGCERTALVLAVLAWATPGHAQSASRFGLDSAVSVDLFRGENASDRPNIIIDITAVAHLGNGWMIYARPWLRQPREPEWDKEVYQAAVQYARPGRIATRLDLGFIASPIGLGMLDTRPGVNPTIGPHYSYFLSMPAFDAAAPRVPAIASTYPLGGTFTASTHKWDARAALVSSAPTRSFELNGEGNPRSTPVIEVGAGISPTVGLRFGASLARGDYATGDELRLSSDHGRALTLAAFEGEYAFRHTKITGELTRDHFDTGTGSDTAHAWFIQAMQAISPRWFVAGRQEGVSAATALAGSLKGTHPKMHYSEGTVGYRLSPEFTLRGSFLARKSFTRSDWDQQAGVSLVWSRRWR